ncbi:GNAT family N-acetyltransferase [Paenibacillus sp. GYB004]|uniref:GNAT family N-acetyltransferase n=1 Tax=Paenibacillus sp. GYB004 TaxID=2994393 RepID=UPI002F96B54A
MQEQFRIISLGECTNTDITALWNTGFEQYIQDMTRTEFQMAVRLGKLHIHPDLSVAAYKDGAPAGFVMIGWREAFGRKLAWNGGTGVAVAYRGRGLSKLLLAEAIRRMRANGAERLSLEARTDNERAVAAYRSQGFAVADRLIHMRQDEDFAHIPFRRERDGGYYSVRGVPELASRLPFYVGGRSSWTTEWFSMDGGQSLIAFDRSGRAAGYALFHEEYNGKSGQSAIRLCHCEADPDRDDTGAVIRYMLAELMKPGVSCVSRGVHYVRASNSELVEALIEAGFVQTQEEYLMHLVFG